MALYVLDTDSITFHQAERETLLRHVRSLSAESVCTTVITLYEQMRGRVARIHRAQESCVLIAACGQLSMEFLSPVIDGISKRFPVF